MKSLFRSALLALVLTIASSLNAAAWDETGHKITGYIAWQTMTPAVRERVFKILMKAPEDSDIATFWITYGTRADEIRKREYFMLLAYWADIVRDRNSEVRYKKYHHSNWHYSDTFWTLKDGSIQVLPDPEDGGRALEKLKEFEKAIRGNSSDAQKAVAIVWLQHLIGDVHQPLHTSARVTDTEPKGDQGGNLFSLTPKGTPRDKQEDLHWYWDSIVRRNIPNSKDLCDAEYMVPIAEKIMKEHPYAVNQKDLQSGQFESWIRESLTLAQNDVFSPDLKRWEMPSEKYKKKAFKIGRKRLAMAGYRMGELFNSAFGETTTPAN